jgi:hypothetical protein
MKKKWISIKDSTPDNYNDKKIKLSDGTVLMGYYDVKSNTWCGSMPEPLLSKDDPREVIEWLELGNCDSLLKHN